MARSPKSHILMVTPGNAKSVFKGYPSFRATEFIQNHVQSGIVTLHYFYLIVSHHVSFWNCFPLLRLPTLLVSEGKSSFEDGFNVWKYSKAIQYSVWLVMWTWCDSCGEVGKAKLGYEYRIIIVIFMCCWYTGHEDV